MDIRFTEGQERLRREIREFIEKELPHGVEIEEEFSDEVWPLAQAVAHKLADKGWLTMAWPQEYGGRGASTIELAIYREEMAYHGVPGIDMGIGGVFWVGPMLMMFGNEEQKREHLPRIARGERWWCTGYSEPGAGSDLASLRTRAVADGDDYVVDGQKLWTSGGHRADWCVLAARTNPDVPKHKGMSLILVDMKTPGIIIRPLVDMADVHHLNEVFFEGVRVPKRNLVGQENQGWYQLAAALDIERSAIITHPARGRRTLDELVQYVKETQRRGRALAQDPLVRTMLADMAIEVDISRLLSYRVAWMYSKGLAPNYEVSISKIYGSEMLQHLASVGMRILGLGGQLMPGSKWAPLSGRIGRLYLAHVARTIGGGTTEIQRNIIAQRGLGLPRD